MAAPRLALPSVCKGDTIVVSMANWDRPKRGSPSATTSSRLPSAWSCCTKSMSRTKTFVRTLAPPSLHSCWLLLTPTPNLCVPTPLLLRQAGRWWPQGDNWTATPVKGRGERSLRRRSTRKGAESNLALRSEGKLVNGVLANGPRCDHNIACSCSRNLGQTTWSWSYCSIAVPAFFCHPTRG